MNINEELCDFIVRIIKLNLQLFNLFVILKEMAYETYDNNRVYLSYSSPAEDEFKDQLVKDLKQEKIERETSEKIASSIVTTSSSPKNYGGASTPPPPPHIYSSHVW